MVAVESSAVINDLAGNAPATEFQCENNLGTSRIANNIVNSLFENKKYLAAMIGSNTDMRHILRNLHLPRDAFCFENL